MSRSVHRPLPLLLLALAACMDADPVLHPGGDARLNTAVQTSVSVVMSGLENPRGLAFGPEGALYVAESGTPQINGPCVAVYRGDNCYSGTGAITRLWRGQQERIASGLPSVFLPQASDVTGPHHISFQGRGEMYVTIGWGGDPAARAGLGAAGHGLGTLIRMQPNGNWRVAADIAALEGSLNPDGRLPDANPYGVAAVPGRQFVADAGGNSLVQVSARGDMSVVAVFPAIPVPAGPFNPPFAEQEPVPTAARQGPDGAIYVATLTGVPFLPGSAAIYRVVPGQAPQIHEGGFGAIVDFDWGPDGSLYVLQFASGPFLAPPGALIRVAPGGARSTVTTDLVVPTGLAAGPDGALYVSNFGPVPGMGQVLRIVP
jgi:hypothetical protein